MTARSDTQPQAPPAAPAAPAHDDGETEPPLERARLAVDVVMDDEEWPGFANAEAAVLQAAAALAGHPGVISEPCEAVIALSSDAEVARLNGAYRNQPKPTNVLSFPAAPSKATLAAGDPKALGVGSLRSLGSGSLRSLGDIILARETILREAEASGTKPVHHLQHLVIHGLLHLLGYDHMDDAQAVQMETLETAILARLAVPDPYAPDPGEHRQP